MEYYFRGRADGIGNRIEQMIIINNSNLDDIIHYYWNNSGFRKYECLIEFDGINIVGKEMDNLVKYKLKKSDTNNKIRYKFLFELDNSPIYDAIIHVRAGDRIINNPDKVSDFQDSKILNYCKEKTIEFINNRSDINTYTIIGEDIKIEEELKKRIDKKYINLEYPNNIDKDWYDYYLLTIPNEYIIMCSKFSSYSVTASILGNKKIVSFFEENESNLIRYNADVIVYK